MNIYVGNLSYKTTDDDLRQHFERFGEVSSAAVITDRTTGQSKGFGFVEMPNKNEADEAIEQTNGAEMNGRQLRVNEAQPRPRSGGGGPGRGGPGRGGGGGGRGGGGHRR